jgi:hypothetical protein
MDLRQFTLVKTGFRLYTIENHRGGFFMPPFINTNCAFCTKPNRFDLAELRKENGSLVKGTVYHREDENTEEFEETCQHCGRKFKFTVKGGNDGREK